MYTVQSKNYNKLQVMNFDIKLLLVDKNMILVSNLTKILSKFMLIPLFLVIVDNYDFIYSFQVRTLVNSLNFNIVKNISFY